MTPCAPLLTLRDTTSQRLFLRVWRRLGLGVYQNHFHYYHWDELGSSRLWELLHFWLKHDQTVTLHLIMQKNVASRVAVLPPLPPSRHGIRIGRSKTWREISPMSILAPQVLTSKPSPSFITLGEWQFSSDAYPHESAEMLLLPNRWWTSELVHLHVE